MCCLTGQAKSNEANEGAVDFEILANERWGRLDRYVSRAIGDLEHCRVRTLENGSGIGMSGKLKIKLPTSNEE